MKLALILGLLLLSLQSCSILDFIKPAGLEIDTKIKTDVIDGNKSVGTEADVAVASRITGKQERTTNHNTAENITQTYTNIYEGKSIWDMFLMMLISFLAGWLLMPSSRQMIIMIKKRFGRTDDTAKS